MVGLVSGDVGGFEEALVVLGQSQSVKMCVRNHVDIIYHASFTDAEGMDMLEANKDWVFVAPGINWLIATLYEAEAFGFPQEAAEAVGYKKELEMAEAGLREMHRRGVRILPGGDYGFAWTPHGTYARDLEHFVERLGFTPMEAILSATALGGSANLAPPAMPICSGNRAVRCSRRCAGESTGSGCALQCRQG